MVFFPTQHVLVDVMVFPRRYPLRYVVQVVVTAEDDVSTMHVVYRSLLLCGR